MAIYTKTGDKGSTKVFDRKTGNLTAIPKSSVEIQAIGAIDELNSILGVVISFSDDKSLHKALRKVQDDLFTANSVIAGSNLKFLKERTKKLEHDIDMWEGRLPVLKNFIYYGGSRTASLMFYARSICRRVERFLVLLSNREEVMNLLSYINRLSDYLFMLARKINYEQKMPQNGIGNKVTRNEDYWISKKTS